MELREIAELRLDHLTAETDARFSGKPPDHSAVDTLLQVDLKTLIGMESRLLKHSLESPLLPCIVWLQGKKHLVLRLNKIGVDIAQASNQNFWAVCSWPR